MSQQNGQEVQSVYLHVGSGRLITRGRREMNWGGGRVRKDITYTLSYSTNIDWDIRYKTSVTKSSQFTVQCHRFLHL